VAAKAAKEKVFRENFTVVPDKTQSKPSLIEYSMVRQTAAFAATLAATLTNDG